MILYCSLRKIYCSKLKLQVNVEKIKVLLSNSNGKSFIDEFTYKKIYVKVCQNIVFSV